MAEMTRRELVLALDSVPNVACRAPHHLIRPAGVELSGLNLRGLDLAHADLAGTDLRAFDLSDAVLAGADPCGADFRDATLARVDFRGARLDRRTRLSGSTPCCATPRQPPAAAPAVPPAPECPESHRRPVRLRLAQACVTA